MSGGDAGHGPQDEPLYDVGMAGESGGSEVCHFYRQLFLKGCVPVDYVRLFVCLLVRVFFSLTCFVASATRTEEQASKTNNPPTNSGYKT